MMIHEVNFNADELDIHNRMSRDINLVGCIYIEEFYDGSTWYRARMRPHDMTLLETPGVLRSRFKDSDAHLAWMQNEIDRMKELRASWS